MSRTETQEDMEAAESSPKSEVYNIDCMQYMSLCEDNQFDLAIADPPYGIGITKDGKFKNRFVGRGKLSDRAFTTGNVQWDNQRPPDLFFEELFRISKNQIIFGGNYFSLPPTRCVVVWDKVQPFENMSQVEIAWTSFEFPAKLFSFDNRKAGAKIHPTQKPVQLYNWLLKGFAKQGDRIFDPMMGSQSSRIAAYCNGFDFVGCELDKTFFEEGCARFEHVCKGIAKVKNHTYKQLDLF